jgi:hypothetical protein
MLVREHEALDQRRSRGGRGNAGAYPALTPCLLLRLGLLLIPLLMCRPAAAEFVHPLQPTDPLVYGIKDGIVVAIHPDGLGPRGPGGPRGLLRVGYQEAGQNHLLNFIAVEPLVGAHKGFSELEKGGDDLPGKRFWIGSSAEDGGVGRHGNVAGRIADTPDGRALSFVLHVEPFANGARPVVEVSLFEKWPHRIRFRTFSGRGGQAMRQCILTATMGNRTRCRVLWLRSLPVLAPTLYAGYGGNDFVEKGVYPLDALQQTQAGDVVVALSPDECEPREAWPLPTDAWHPDGPWMAQYWLKTRGSYDQSLCCRVNGRRVYWAGTCPIPGGIAYENFEFRERFQPGRELWFGYTTQSPSAAFGFTYNAAPAAAARRTVSQAEVRALADAAASARPLTNGDFAANLDGWHSEGGAGAFRTFVQGHAKALTTFGEKKEADTGRLFQCFQIPADATELRFRLHGGADSDRTYVALWCGDRLYRKMTGRNDNTPFRVSWDVKPLRGQVVTLEVVDESTDAWGFIGVQGFALVSER